MNGRGWRSQAASHSIIRVRVVVIAVTFTLILTGTPSRLVGQAAGQGSPDPTSPPTLVVNTAADSDDGACGLAPDPCSLRDAIEAADASPGLDTIDFDITSGPLTISLTAALPAVTDPVAIDGTSEPGVRLDGAAISTSGVDGLHVLESGSGSTITGLEIEGFTGSGMLLDGAHDTVIGGELEATPGAGNVIHGNGNDGVTVIGDATAIDNSILGNLIYDNGDLAIDLGDRSHPTGVGCPVSGDFPGPNSLQCAPFLTVGNGPISSVDVGAVGPTELDSARVEFFWSPTCPSLLPSLVGSYVADANATTFLGSIDVPLSTDAPGEGSHGTATFTLGAALTSGFLTATTTTPAGTSQFAPCSRIPTPTDEQMSVTAAPLLATAGESATIETTVTNNGPYRDDEVLADVDLSGVPSTIVSATSPAGSCSLAVVPDVACELDGLEPGDAATITIVLTPTTDGTWSATAEVDDFYGVDPVPANDSVLIPITVGGATPVGAGTVVDTGGATPTATLTFDQVTAAGTTSVTTSTSAPTLPAGYQIGDPPAYYDIETTATYSGAIVVCISDAGVDPAPTNLLHYVGGGWQDITTSVDTANQRICGSTTSLSPFALVTRIATAPGAPTAVTASAGNRRRPCRGHRQPPTAGARSLATPSRRPRVTR